MNSGLIYASVASVIWGLVYVLDQKILTALSPVAFLFISSLLVVTILLPVVLFGAIDFHPLALKGTMLGLILVAGLLAICANILVYSSIGLVGASTESLLEIAYPLFVVLFSVFLLHSVPTWPVLAGGVLIMTGSFIIIRFS